MSISAHAKHVMSAMLIVVFAYSASGWASVKRTTHCLHQADDCCPAEVITCCGPTAPTPIDRVPLTQFAPPSLHVSTVSLMDHSLLPAPSASAGDVPSPHWVRVLDLLTLHRSLVI
jgi:hypothetical protein